MPKSSILTTRFAHIHALLPAPFHLSFSTPIAPHTSNPHHGASLREETDLYVLAPLKNHVSILTRYSRPRRSLLHRISNSNLNRRPRNLAPRSAISTQPTSNQILARLEPTHSIPRMVHASFSPAFHAPRNRNLQHRFSPLRPRRSAHGLSQRIRLARLRDLQ